MTEYRTIVLSVTATIEIPDDESHLDHQRSLCNVIKGIPDVTCVEVESSKISGDDMQRAAEETEGRRRIREAVTSASRQLLKW